MGGVIRTNRTQTERKQPQGARRKKRPRVSRKERKGTGGSRRRKERKDEKDKGIRGDIFFCYFFALIYRQIHLLYKMKRNYKHGIHS